MAAMWVPSIDVSRLHWFKRRGQVAPEFRLSSPSPFAVPSERERKRERKQSRGERVRMEGVGAWQCDAPASGILSTGEVAGGVGLHGPCGAVVEQRGEESRVAKGKDGGGDDGLDSGGRRRAEQGRRRAPARWNGAATTSAASTATEASGSSG